MLSGKSCKDLIGGSFIFRRFMLLMWKYYKPVSVIQKLDIALSRIIHLVSLILIYWIMIYPVDCSISF